MKGIFLGSFDPPHIGHVNVVITALNSGIVDEIDVIPAFKNVWKDTKTSFVDRFNMCLYTFSDIPKVNVSNVEDLISNEPLPTYKTLEYLHKKEEDFYIITTSETYHEIFRWEHGDEILENNKFIIIRNKPLKGLEITDNIKILDIPKIEISSTILRNMINKRMLLQPFIKSDVIYYINRHNLYL